MSSEETFSLKTWLCSLSYMEFSGSLTLEGLDKQRRKLAKKYHPDRCSDCGDLMQKINDAVIYLENHYDQGLIESESHLEKTLQQYFPHTDMTITGNEAILLKLSGEYNDCE